MSNKINASKKTTRETIHIHDGGWRKQGESWKNTGTDGREQRVSRRESSARGEGEGRVVVQCSIFVSSSFSVSSLSSVWGAFSFSSSSVGLGELLLTVENRNNTSSHQKGDYPVSAFNSSHSQDGHNNNSFSFSRHRLLLCLPPFPKIFSKTSISNSCKNVM